MKGASTSLTFIFLFVNDVLLVFFSSEANDEAAEIAKYCEAMSNEGIMVDFMSTVKTRSSRASCFVDPREKRQTLLEELYAQRARVF